MNAYRPIRCLVAVLVDMAMTAIAEANDPAVRRREQYRVQSVARWALVAMLIATLSLFPQTAVEASQDVFTVAVTSDVVTLDPAVAEDGASALVATQVFDSLLAYQGSDQLPIPSLAAYWTTSADGRSWTFYLRPGVRFHDGAPMNADAVVFNIRRWWDPAHPYHQGSFAYFQFLFGGFKGDPNCLLDDVYAAGPLAVVIELSRADSTILSSLALPFFSIASPAAIQAGTQASTPVGTGPFRFVEQIPGDRVRLEANTDHWRGAPRSQNLVFQVMPSATDRLNALKSGTVQVADNAVGAAADPELRVLTRTALNVGYLGINRDHTPLGNLLVRQAIAHAVDKEHVLAVGYSGGTQAADQFLPRGLWGRDPTIVDYDYSPALARSLLIQAGYDTGITTTLSYRPAARGYMPNPQAVAQTLKADMETAGIHLVITEYESGTFLNKVYAGELDLFLLGWNADIPHPDNFFSWHFCRPAGFGPLDDELCNQLTTARANPNLAGQEAIYQWASRRVHETLPLVPLANGSSGLTTRYDVVGVVASPLGLESYKEARVVGAAYSTVPPADGGILSFTDANDRPTTAQVPPNAIDQPTTFHLIEAETESAPASRGSAHHAFDLDASRDGVPLAGFTFAAPISITIAYSDADLIGVWENTLALYYWDGTTWHDAATTCSPSSTYTHDQVSNQISVAICHLSQFALFGERWPSNYLPLVVR
ncbi:MAG: ABC transporter substrate-binding protein [Chloroflexi bacterium]|nr:ABC transporter substrate-binding protein [Chloroflexota bacterium]